MSRTKRYIPTSSKKRDTVIHQKKEPYSRFERKQEARQAMKGWAYVY